MNRKTLPKLSQTSLSDVELRSTLYVVLLWILATAAVAAVISAHARFGEMYVVGLLAVVAAVAERGRVELSPHVSHSISLVPTLFAAVLFGPLAAIVVAASSYALECHRPYLKWASYTATRTLTAAGTGVAALIVHNDVPSRFGGVAVAALVAAV